MFEFVAEMFGVKATQIDYERIMGKPKESETEGAG